jgi:YVTN family beta-propeller protein
MRNAILAIAFALVACVGSAAAPSATYHVFVTNERGGDVTVIDPRDNQVVATIPVGKRPRGIRASADGTKLYVALSGTPITSPNEKESKGVNAAMVDSKADGIGVIDAATMKLIVVLPGGKDPEGLVMSHDGRRLYISNEDGNAAAIVDIAAKKLLKTIPTGEEPEGVAVSPDGSRVYITCETTSQVYVLDTTKDDAVIARIATPQRPRAAAFLPDGSKAFVTCEVGGAIAVIDVAANKVVHTIKPDGENVRPMGICLSPGGDRVYVTTGRGGSVVVIDPKRDEVEQIVPDVGPRPWGIALSPDGQTLFVANGPSNDVAVLDASSQQVVAHVKAGQSPWGVAIGK